MRTPTAVAVVLLSGLACLGVPSAAADELLPTPAETSAVTAPADEPAPEPTPEPSQEPTTELTAPEPDEIAAPTEDPAQPAGNEAATSSDEAADEPTAAGDETTPPAEGTGDPQTVEEGEAPRAEATVAEEALAAAAVVVRDPRASIGDVNCANLTLPVTLDNSRSSEAVSYEVLAVAENEHIFDDVVQVSAGAIRVLELLVTEDTRLSIWVADITALLSSAVLAVDCTDDEAGHDPRAAIGDVDCAQMTVDVTLDNSRSEDETTYFVYASVDDEPLIDEDGQTINVPAGDVQTVLVPVVENRNATVSVWDLVVLEETEGEEGYLADEQFRVDCTPGDQPLASIGDVNCTSLTVPVTLDNARWSEKSFFLVLAGASENEDPNEEWVEHEAAFVVAAEAERVVTAPVSNNADVTVLVEALGAGFDLNDVILAHKIFEVDCPRTAARPTVTVKGAKLAQTGGFNLALPLLGVALLTGGAGMLALSGRRRRY